MCVAACGTGTGDAKGMVVVVLVVVFVVLVDGVVVSFLTVAVIVHADIWNVVAKAWTKRRKGRRIERTRPRGQRSRSRSKSSRCSRRGRRRVGNRRADGSVSAIKEEPDERAMGAVGGQERSEVGEDVVQRRMQAGGGLRACKR